MLGVFVAVLGAGCKRFEDKPKAPEMPPPEVMVMKVGTQDVPLTSEWIGSVDGVVNAQVRAKVQGFILSQAYENGGLVKKGDLLFQIDPRPFQAALETAQGRLAQAKAELGEAEAVLGKTEIDVNRYTPLAAERAISQQELDNAIQARLAARAQVEAAKANIAAAQAQEDDAQLNLNYTKVTSPVDGIAAIATAQVGDLVGPDTGLLTTVSQVDPARVLFPISEGEFERAWEKLDGRTVQSSKMSLELILADGSVYPERGTLSAANLQVDPKTGTITIIGLFPNPTYLLRPGQYAKIRAVTKTLDGAIVIPQRAVSEVQGAAQVFVVGPGEEIQVRPVEVGRSPNGSDVIITKGLQAGETLVVEGFMKARPGMRVRTKPWTADTAPAPAASAAKG